MERRRETEGHDPCASVIPFTACDEWEMQPLASFCNIYMKRLPVLFCSSLKMSSYAFKPDPFI